MKDMLKTYSFFLFLLLFSLFITFSISQAEEFDTLVVPSLMDSNMDGWYKIPINSGPVIHHASSVYQGQMFNLLIFFRNYSADKNNNLHLTYDVQVYDPEGNPTEDMGTDILAYKGPMGNPDALMLNQEFLRIVFTEKYQLGTYKIKVTAYDKISGKKFVSEAPIELTSFELPEKFESTEETEAWLMGYFQSPTPEKAISGVQSVVEPNSEWQNDNLNILYFFRRIFTDNQFLFKNIAIQLNSFSKEDQKKFLLISAICNDPTFEFLINDGRQKELYEFYKSAKEIKFPDLTGDIYSAVQLDMLWSEFLATGKYDPIKKILSALALNKYIGTLDKIKSKEIEVTKEIERNAYFEATYRSAVWSLISNCKQFPLVFKYCVFMYENENFDANIKDQLGSILTVAQKELQEENENSEPKS